MHPEELVILLLEDHMGLTRELKLRRSLRDTTHFGGIQMPLSEWQAKLSLKRKKRTI